MRPSSKQARTRKSCPLRSEKSSACAERPSRVKLASDHLLCQNRVRAGVAELADASDLESSAPRPISCLPQVLDRGVGHLRTTIVPCNSLFDFGKRDPQV